MALPISTLSRPLSTESATTLVILFNQPIIFHRKVIIRPYATNGIADFKALNCTSGKSLETLIREKLNTPTTPTCLSNI